MPDYPFEPIERGAIVTSVQAPGVQAPPVGARPDAPGPFWLRATSSSGRQAPIIALRAGRNLIGTSSVCEVQIADPFVAPIHALLTADDDALVLREAGGVHGVFLRVSDAFALEDGDEFVVGQQRFLVELEPYADREYWGRRGTLGAPHGPNYPRLVRLGEGGSVIGIYPARGPLRIGRAPELQIPCPEDASLADHHASVEAAPGGGLRLVDGGARAGTYIRVNTKIELYSGDSFLIGETIVAVGSDAG